MCSAPAGSVSAAVACTAADTLQVERGKLVRSQAVERRDQILAAEFLSGQKLLEGTPASGVSLVAECMHSSGRRGDSVGNWAEAITGGGDGEILQELLSVNVVTAAERSPVGDHDCVDHRVG